MKLIDSYIPVRPVDDTLERASEWIDGNFAYFFELWDAGAEENPVDSIHLLYVNSVQVQVSQSVDRCFTLTNMIEQYSGIRERIYTISGKSGDQYADLVKFYKIINFFTDLSLKKVSTENAFIHDKRYRVRMRMLKEREDIEATILNFAYKREAGINTNSFEYQLVVAARQDFSLDRGTTLEVQVDPPTEPTAVGNEGSEEGVKPPEVGEVPPTGAEVVPEDDVGWKPAVSLAELFSSYGDLVPSTFQIGVPWIEFWSVANRSEQAKGELQSRTVAQGGYTPNSDYAKYATLYYRDFPAADDAETNVSIIRENLESEKSKPNPDQEKIASLQKEYNDSRVYAAKFRYSVDYNRGVINIKFRSKVVYSRLGQLEGKQSLGTITEDELRELEVIKKNIKNVQENGVSVQTAPITAGVEGGSFESTIRRLKAGGTDTLAGAAGGGASGAANSTTKAKVEKLKENTKKVADATKIITQATSSPDKSSTNWLDDVYKFVGGTDAALYNGIVTTLTTPLTEINKIRNYISPIVSGLSNISYAFRSLVGSYYNFLPEWKSYAFGTVASIKSSFESMKQTYGMLEDMTSERYWRELGSGWENIWGSSGPNRRQMSVYLPTSNTQVIPVSVPGGVLSAYDAARRFLGRRDRWRDIVTANNMRDAYTKQDGLPLKVGDVIFVPDSNGSPSQSITLRGTFGSDLMIKNGDLVLRGEHSFQTVEGPANFEQNLSHRIKTVVGSNRAFPSFGMPKTLNERQTSILLAQFSANVSNQVYADRRVKKVKSLRVAEFPTKYVARVELELANLETKTISLEYTPAI